MPRDDAPSPSRSEVPALRRVTVWDPWVRLVHWAIVLLIPFSWWTAETARYDLHFLSGYAILTLVGFRVLWGLVGSDTARFARFLRSPAAALRHLGELRHRPAKAEIGHNAAGGWMVLAMLALILVQAVTGLFASDLIFTHGPLARRVDEAWSDLATSVHIRVFWVIVAAVVLHVAAIAAYRLLRGTDLVRPMVTGRISLPAGDSAPPPRLGHPLLAVALLAAVGGVVWYVASLPPVSAF